LKKQVYAVLLTAAIIAGIFYLSKQFGVPHYENGEYGDGSDISFLLYFFIIGVFLLLLKEIFTRKK